MRNKILLYLFIFATLFTIYIYINDKKILDAKQESIEQLKEKDSLLEAKNDSLTRANLDLSYFSLNHNEEAISYFEKRGIDVEQLQQKLEDEIISRNKADKDNDLVPFEGMEGVMRINKVKVLNHKWIIADFTDGTYWGELLISYEISDKNELTLKTEKSFLYAKD
ncbi:MAG: hypothetical protein WCD31_01265 [Gillisia sp.]